MALTPVNKNLCNRYRLTCTCPTKSNHLLTLWCSPKTDNRLGAVEVTIPPHTQGPQPHWHEMHDETFLITKGTVRFKNPGNDNYQEYDAKVPNPNLLRPFQ